MPPTPDNPAVIDQHFNQVDQSPSEKCKIYECSYCRKRYAMNVTRMKLHLQSCTQCPLSVKKTLKIKRHKSSLQAALMKSDLLSSPNVYEHLIKMETPSHDLVEMDDSSMSASNAYTETVTFVDSNREEHPSMVSILPVSPTSPFSIRLNKFSCFQNESQDQDNHSAVYQHYNKLPEKPNDKCTTFACNYCQKKYAKNVTRMKLHLISCSKCPPEVQKSLKIKRHLMTRMDVSRASVDMYESMAYGAPEFVEVGENQDSMDFSNVLNSIRKLTKRETVIRTILAFLFFFFLRKRSSFTFILFTDCHMDPDGASMLC